ncbi:MAG: cupin domain-containing protein, partial [Rhodospirillales bacterium]|nr:cupin domain-containing protein [Acetobacter sp.]
VSEAGWARQVTIEDLKVARDLAGVNMRLLPNACRELHWHESSEWAYMLAGKARVTCIDYDGKAFVDDIEEGDLWFFPSGIPHSIQGHPDTDGCEFLLVFDDGHFSEYETFLISEWVARTPKDVLSLNTGIPESAMEHLPKEEQYIFFVDAFKGIEEERKQASGRNGYSPIKFTFHLKDAKPKVQNKHGEVIIIDSKNFPISTKTASAIVTVKPGGLRELHWHPNADEWQYYLKGKGRMCIYAAGNRARTMDVQAGDVGYIPITQAHYIQNTGTEDLVFLELFKSDFYADFSLNDWMSHTPENLVKSHLHIDQAAYDAIVPRKDVIVPA